MSWTIIYIIDLSAIGLFLVSYYRNCYRKGYRVDFWHAQLMLYCVIPNMLMLAPSTSRLNIVIVGSDFSRIIAVLPEIFLITIVGYLSILAGGSLWRLRLGIGVRSTTARMLNVIPRCSMMLMSSRSILIFQAFICVLLQVLILGIYFAHNGFGFDLREYTFANPSLRPVALFVSGYSIIIGSHCFARYVETKEKVCLATTLMLTFGLVFFGARSNILFIYMNVLLCYLVQLRAKISLLRITVIISIIVVGGLYLGSVRAGDYSLGAFFELLGAALLYGNTFSDLRDFAWVYALWNHQFWLGKTYLAAITAFVPRFASEFRDTWGLGVATAKTLGFDPHVHPGVRPGAFGEGFFNFGIIGVVGIGIILGILIRRVDVDVKVALSGQHPSIMEAFASSMLLSIAGAISISSSFSGIYVLLLVYVFSWFCLAVQRLVGIRRVVSINAD